MGAGRAAIVAPFPDRHGCQWIPDQVGDDVRGDGVGGASRSARGPPIPALIAFGRDDESGVKY